VPAVGAEYGGYTALSASRSIRTVMVRSPWARGAGGFRGAGPRAGNTSRDGPRASGVTSSNALVSRRHARGGCLDRIRPAHQARPPGEEPRRIATAAIVFELPAVRAEHHDESTEAGDQVLPALPVAESEDR
jgi:hypothetical protein